MAELKMYDLLTLLFQDIVNGLSGIVVQAFTGENHVYFVVEKFNPRNLLRKYPHLRSFAKLGQACDRVFKAEIDFSKADMDIHEFSQCGIGCDNCDFAGTLNYHNGVPADRANEVWKAFKAHNQTKCKQVALYTIQ